MAKPKTRIRDAKHAAELARDLASLRESIRHAKTLEAQYTTALKRWLSERREVSIEQEGFDTLALREQISGYDWDMVRMPDEDLEELRHLGLLTVKKGEYDAAVEQVGPMGLLDRYATPRYTVALRFEKPPIKRPRRAPKTRRERDGEELTD